MIPKGSNPMRPLALAAVLTLMTLATPVLAAGVTPGNETPVQRHQAESLFFRGKSFVVMKKYDEALADFHASLDIVASPNTRLLIARCLRDQGKLVAAYVEFERTLVEAKELVGVDPRYGRAIDGAQDDLKAIEPKIAFVTVHVTNATDTTTLTIAHEEIRRAAWGEPAPVAIGTSDVVVSTPGRTPVQTTITVAAAERKSIDVDAAGSDGSASTGPTSTTPADASGPNDRTKLRPYAYVAAGVGVVGLATFFIAGAMANSKYSDLQSSCPNNACPPSKSDEISGGKSAQTIANVGLVFGILGAGAGVTLYVLGMPKRTTETAPPAAALVVGPSWLGVRGAF
jgi:hypothetical protein